MTRILVTPRSMTAVGLEQLPELDPLRERGWELVSGPIGSIPTETQLIGLLSEVDGWLAGVETITDAVLDAAPHLRVISRNGVGADAIDLDAARARGVEVAVARGANSRGVAELAFGLLLDGLRGIAVADAAMHRGEWVRSMGREMPSTTIGIVGYGAIGRLVARFALALDAHVIAADPFAEIDDARVEQVPLDELFSRANAVTLHSPPPPDGSPLVTRERLGAMPGGGAVLVNTARSALVDSAAVLEALDSGRLSLYAVDAYDSEPPVLSELLRHPHTLMTPHLGGYTGDSVTRATVAAVANLVATLES
jgi:D-3-phosphoglycerate dehydrogenase